MNSGSNGNQMVVDRINRPVAISSFVLLGTIGVLSFIVQPALVQGFVTQLGLGEAAAVDLAGIEMAGVALATVAIALVSGRANWRLLIGAGMAAAVIGNIMSAFASEATLGFARFVAGIGHGTIIALSFTFVGLTRKVDRNLAFYLVLLLSYGAIGLWAAPTLFASVGLRGIFLFFAAATVLSTITIPFVPRSADERPFPSPRAAQLPVPLLIVALAGVLAYNLAQGIAWANLFLIGVDTGIAEQPVADALFVSQIVAVAGALVAVFLSDRAGRIIPILIGIGGGAMFIALLLGEPGATTFLIAVCGFNFLWNFVLPFILAAVCDMDGHGRMMSPAIAMQMIGLGLGPILSARLIGDGDFLVVELVCIGFFLISLLLLAAPLLAHREKAGSHHVAALR